MAMGEETSGRQRAIALAITEELDRQAKLGVGRIDVDELAQAIDEALDPSPPLAEGRRPEDLNSTNDD